ncbi:MAG: SPFH/Band 7/PHB domain protein [candidate division Zixibacteria bacterium]|nr:SPFH/Band 7/PHB domain protein [candidate division Zixibacteria bacterium]MDH3936496.1 SPFH/Band 7/PHB domain protein [candidate division Zixibacteria bacterium]MDH4032878.1 SPFH/Band 7/PHB domain protein [candidate division Zixibacteria bacterium]
MNPALAVALGVAVLFVIILVSMSIRIIRPFEKGLIERLGKYQRLLDPGLNMIVPFFDTVIKVDMREVVLDVPPQMVITKDNVNVEVDAIIYCQVTDPVRSRYEIANYIVAATKLAQTNLRNVIGEMDLDACLSSRDTVNAQLRDVLDEATDKWGVRVNRVEMQRIDPPRDITDAMSRQMKAERDKRATILDAEAVRQSDITKAEGYKQAKILEAEGNAEAVKKRADAEMYRQETVAKGEAQAILNVFNAIHAGKPDENLITLKYLEMLPKLAEGEANKIFLPYEASGIISSLAAMVEGIKGKADGPAKTDAAVAPAQNVEAD